MVKMKSGFLLKCTVVCQQSPTNNNATTIMETQRIESIESIFAEASTYIQNLGKDTVLEGRSELQSPIPSPRELNPPRRQEAAAVEHTVVVSIPSVERGCSYFHHTTPLRSFAQATGTDCGERLFKDAGYHLDTFVEKTQPYQVFPEQGVHALGLDWKVGDELGCWSWD